MEDKIYDIISKVCKNESIKENKEIDLIESGLIDSLSFMELVAELETEFNIEFELTTISTNTWRKVDKIIELVKSYLKEE